jgi:peptidoglycan/LPS O-acetylase OafA/YrhL
VARIAYLESIRGLAALQVLLMHFFAAFAPDLVNALPRRLCKRMLAGAEQPLRAECAMAAE